MQSMTLIVSKYQHLFVPQPRSLALKRQPNYPFIAFEFDYFIVELAVMYTMYSAQN